MEGYFTKTRHPGVSLVMVAPLLVVYEVGLLVVGFQALNGADFVTQQLLRLGGVGFVTVNLAILAAFSGGLYWLRKEGTDARSYFIPVFLESGFYAVVMGTLILKLMEGVHLLGPIAERLGLFTRIVISAGAGLHEELVFRLMLMGGIAWAAKKMLGAIEFIPFAIALVLSSVLFSLAHFTAEPFGWFAFWFRTFAGMFFGILFALRGFAVAAYTHTFYDVYVLVIRG
jgi:membrane protease YdiL (CAAX protease family)